MSDKPVWQDGHWEVGADTRGDQVPTPYQRMDTAERKRIIRQRLRYIDFMHDHFADRLVAPPEGVEEIETSHPHG